jgi:hypothetical protein
VRTTGSFGGRVRAVKVCCAEMAAELGAKVATTSAAELRAKAAAELRA